MSTIAAAVVVTIIMIPVVLLGLVAGTIWLSNTLTRHSEWWR